MEYILIGIIGYAAVIGFVWSLCKVASDADDEMERWHEEMEKRKGHLICFDSKTGEYTIRERKDT